MVFESPEEQMAEKKGESSNEEQKIKKDSKQTPKWKVFEFSPSAGVAMLA